MVVETADYGTTWIVHMAPYPLDQQTVFSTFRVLVYQRDHFHFEHYQPVPFSKPYSNSTVQRSNVHQRILTAIGVRGGAEFPSQKHKDDTEGRTHDVPLKGFKRTVTTKQVYCSNYTTRHHKYIAIRVQTPQQRSIY